MRLIRTLPIIACLWSTTLLAQDTSQVKVMDIYGFAMMDMGYNAGTIHPDWFDVMRPTKLPAFEDQYGSEGNTYFSVRQSRFGVKSYTNTALGELFTQFEFEMFGTGVDAGQTTIRLRHAYGQLGKWGAGQYWSPFMDIDIFPNSVEYWGPTGMAFFRNVQLRYMPIMGDTRLTLAIERPGASADQGPYGDVIASAGIEPRLALPDFSAEYRHALGKSYVELAGIVRNASWEDDNDSLDLDGSALCYGLNLTTNIKYGDLGSAIRAGVVFGQGIQNYMNDATTDIGVRPVEGDNNTPIEGYAIPMIGASAFLDHFWSPKASTTIGYSMIDMDLDEASDSSTLKTGSYALANVMFYPVPNVMWGVEFQWGSRENFKDDWTYDAVRVQLSFKYSFGHSLYRKKAS